MAKTLTQIEVFISCPEDMASERELVQDAISELNGQLEALGLVIKAVTWRDVVPGIGKDPQAVISEQVGESYDAYIGILGARFGSATKRAGSGTEEEFLSACKRFQKEPSSVRLLLYFKTSVSGGLHDIELEQLKQVKEFRDKVGKDFGVLFSDFEDQAKFLKNVREHLWKLVTEQWREGKWVKENAAALAPAAGPKVTDQLPPGPLGEAIRELQDEEETSGGVLDAIVESEEAIERSNVAVENIGAILNDFTQRITSRTAEMQIATAGNRGDARALKRILDGAASDMREMSASLEKGVLAYQSSFDTALSAIEAIATDDEAMALVEAESRRQMAAVTRGLGGSIQGAREQIMEFRTTISGTAAFTGAFKRAKVQVLDILDKFTAILASGIQRLDVVSRRLGPLPPEP